MEKREKLLLHICCAPCSLGVLDDLTKEFEVTLFYFNPNIYPASEYEKRKTEIEKLVEKRYFGMKIIEGEYLPHLFFETAKGLEEEKEGGARCEKCIYMRMRESARLAKEMGFDLFTTTLSVSPHKSYPYIKRCGDALSMEFEVKYLDRDFKKKDGFLKSTKLSKALGVYRQNYCGCKFSIWEDEK